MVEFPQTNVRMGPASEKLYAAVIEERLTHSNDPDLNGHVANAVAKATPRGWRLDKSERGGQVDGVIALAMAVDRAEQREEPARLLGWL